MLGRQPPFHPRITRHPFIGGRGRCYNSQRALRAIQELGTEVPGSASVNLDAYASPGQQKAASPPVYVSQVGGTIRAVGAMVSHVSPGGVLPALHGGHICGDFWLAQSELSPGRETSSG